MRQRQLPLRRTTVSALLYNNASPSLCMRSSISSSSSSLPEPPYDLPRHSGTEAETLGGFSTTWLRSELPAITTAARKQQLYLPSKEDMWNSPMHEFLPQMARSSPYHETLKVIMEHSYFFLFGDIMGARDAPLPHVMYEDFMKCLTFSSLQRTPDTHHALPAPLLRDLLLLCAHHCTTDKHYYYSVRQLFKRMEQQQRIDAEVMSAYVYACAAAEQPLEALAMAQHMRAHQVPFSPVVFAFMMHPSINPIHTKHKTVDAAAKGLVVQQRLGEYLNSLAEVDHNNNAASIALHAMFVYYSLTFKHVLRWECMRLAAQEIQPPIMPLARTRRIAMHVFAKEKGIRCGPDTVKAMVQHVCGDNSNSSSSSAAELVYLLLRVRTNEQLAGRGHHSALQQLPVTAFSDGEKVQVMQSVARMAKKDAHFRVAAPLVEYLLHTEDELNKKNEAYNNNNNNDHRVGGTMEGFISSQSGVPSLQDVLKAMRVKSKALTADTSSSQQHQRQASSPDGDGNDKEEGKEEGHALPLPLPLLLQSAPADAATSSAAVLVELMESLRQMDLVSARSSSRDAGGSSPHGEEDDDDEYGRTADKPLSAYYRAEEGLDASMQMWSAQQAKQADAEQHYAQFLPSSWMGMGK